MADDYSDSEDVSLFTKSPGTTSYTGRTGSTSSATDTMGNGGPRRVVTRDAEQSEPQSYQTESNTAATTESQDPERQADGTPYAIPPYDEMLGGIHEKAMDVAGFGRLQWLLFVVLGCGLMGDGIELMLIAYILPGAEKDLCMDEQRKGWLGAIGFAGMMVGALIWGNLADKVGRRPTLLTSLAINAVFSVTGAFVPVYWMFLLCRLLSGVGIGGSIPIVMAYFGEFCPRQSRGWHIGMLLMFWASGGIYVSALGWLMIPNKELFDLKLNEDTPFHSWRLFILVCTVPVVVSIIGLAFMPESPRYLLQVGRDLDALSVYRKMYLFNHTEAGAEYEMPEIELPNTTIVRNVDDDQGSTFCAKVARALENFWNTMFLIFVSPLTVTSLILCVTWFSTAFGYYGLSIWFPEYIKKLEQEAYFTNTSTISDTSYRDTAYSGFINNINYFNVTFENVSFHDIELRHVIFEMCHIKNCAFRNVQSGQSSFLDTIIDNTVFNSTNLYPEKFHGCVMQNTNFTNYYKGCRVDFDVSYNTRKIFMENFFSQLAVIPTMVFSAFIIDRIGRVKLMVSCLLTAAISVFFIWFTDTEVAVVCISAVFNCVINGAFNAIDVTSLELYPTNLRSTAFGFLSCLGRIAAILGNVAFGNFIGTSKAIPILLTAAILGLGGLVSVKLPESKNKIL